MCYELEDAGSFIAIGLSLFAAGGLDYLAYRELLGPQLVPEGDDLLGRDGCLQDGVDDIVVALFDAFGNFHLARARQQRNCSHLPQVHPNRVIGLARLVL